MIFSSLLLSLCVYAFFVSLVMSIIRRNDLKAQLKYGLTLFLIMVCGAVLFGWLMYLFI
jgi:hypothetical protein